MIWLKQTWEWLKKNWKYVVTFGIPILFSFILNLLRSNQSLKNKVDMRKKELDINKEVNSLGESLRNDAWTGKEDALSSAHREHDLDMEEIRKNERSHLRLIETPEEATEAIKDKIK